MPSKNRVVSTPQKSFSQVVEERMKSPSYRRGYNASVEDGCPKQLPAAPDRVKSRKKWYQGYLDASYPEDDPRYEF